MHTFVRVICACYSALLILHSRRLREAYGQEMVDVLREQMLGGPSLPAVEPYCRRLTQAMASSN